MSFHCDQIFIIIIFIIFVSRYVQTPELTESSECMQCAGTEALWICLICGHVGCGRYQGNIFKILIVTS